MFVAFLSVGCLACSLDLRGLATAAGAEAGEHGSSDSSQASLEGSTSPDSDGAVALDAAADDIDAVATDAATDDSATASADVAVEASVLDAAREDSSQTVGRSAGADAAESNDANDGAEPNDGSSDGGNGTNMCGASCPAACAASSRILDLALPPGSISFGTVGSVCVRYPGNVSGWGVANTTRRQVTVVGTTVNGPLDAALLVLAGSQPGVAAGADGFIYWVFTAGTLDYAFLYIF